MSIRKLITFAFLALVAAALIPALALAKKGTPPTDTTERVFTVPSDGPGPAKFDQVHVHQVGPASAKHVLVLMPGLASGAGDFSLIAQQVVQRIPDLQVWSIDRRSNVLEDTSMFVKLQAGEATLQETYNYYLGWLLGAPGPHTAFLNPSTVPFAREWGMETALNAAHAVVRLARQQGRKVILGGHSLGAVLAEAYAAWDFNGRPGYKDIRGIVLIDGGLLGTFEEKYPPLNQAEAEQAINELQTSNPFEDRSGIGIPELFGIYAELVAYYARLEPTEPAITLQTSPFSAPPLLAQPHWLTNRAAAGYLTDRTYEALGRNDFNAGELGTSAEPLSEPIDWVDGGVTPIENIAFYFGHEPGNGLEWYFPKRLYIDWLGADEMQINSVANFLGLRLLHTHEINVPIYAFQTNTFDKVLRGVHRLIDQSRITDREALLVNGDPDYSHVDPLTAAPDNQFLDGLQVFLDHYVKPPTPLGH
jgi:pimeloyl-ACP methyl ester carboxylesterase